jgi:hypothetical protein
MVGNPQIALVIQISVRFIGCDAAAGRHMMTTIDYFPARPFPKHGNSGLSRTAFLDECVGDFAPLT